jgi:hypothetical protein
MAYLFLTDLLRQVANVLQPAHGGTGSTHGEARLVIEAYNRTAGDLPLYTIVEWATSIAKGIDAVATRNSPSVLGVVVGHYQGGILVEADAPAGAPVAVQTAGIAKMLIESAVTAGEYACAAATAGSIYSSPYLGPGAIGIVLQNADIGQGITEVEVQFPLSGSGSLAGAPLGVWTMVTKAADQSRNSTVGSGTTLNDDTELYFATASGTVYAFEGLLIIDSPAGGGTPNFKMAMIDTAADVTAVSMLSTGTSLAGSPAGISFSTMGGVTAPFGTRTWKLAVTFRGHVVGAGGTLKLQWAQNVGNANNIYVRAGSFIRYRVVA